MKPSTILLVRHKVQQGFSLISAIFLLVVVAGLGAVMVTFFSAQQQSSALDVIGSQANYIAKMGIEWSTYQITKSPTNTFTTTCKGGTFSSPATPAAPILPSTLLSYSLVI